LFAAARAASTVQLKMWIKPFVREWVPVIAWMLMIFAGSTDVLSAEHTSRFLVPFLRWIDPHISFATIAHINTALRKLGHLTEYAILAALLWRALRVTLRSTSRFWLAGFAMTVCGLFAISDEFHQSFVPRRTASENDVLIDICGAMLGLAVCWLIQSGNQEARKFNRQSKIQNRR
jgi:VanZ family protein